MRESEPWIAAVNGESLFDPTKPNSLSVGFVAANDISNSASTACASLGRKKGKSLARTGSAFFSFFLVTSESS